MRRPARPMDCPRLGWLIPGCRRPRARRRKQRAPQLLIKKRKREARKRADARGTWTAPSRQKRGLENGAVRLALSLEGMSGKNAGLFVPGVARTKCESCLAHCLAQAPGPVFWLWTVTANRPSRRYDSDQLAT